MSLFLGKKRSRLGVATKSYSTTQKLHAIQQVRNGERKATVSRAIKVPESTLRGWFKDKKLLQLYEMQRNDRKITTSSEPIDMIALTDSDERSLQRPHCYNNQYKRSISTGPDMNLTQFNSQSNRESAPGLNGSQNRGLCMPYISNPTSLSTMANYFQPSGHSVHSNNIHYAIPSLVLSSLPSDSRGPSQSKPPLFTTPASNDTRKSISQTPAAMNDTKKSILLRHENNELLIESMAIKPPTTDDSNNNYTCNINFNDNIYAAVDLSIERNAIDQPVKCGVGSSTSPESKQPEIINNNKNTPTTAASNDNFNNNNNISTAVDLNIRRNPVDQPKKGTVRLSLPKIQKTTSSDTIHQKQSALSSELSSLNKNYIPDEKENVASIMKSSEALRHAEKFGKWFETFSDPTITTQDFLRFEQLLGKVRKIVK